MNEIGGPETSYLPLLKAGDDPQAWAAHGARVLTDLLDSSPEEMERRRLACQAWAQRFEPSLAINRYLHIYEQVLAASEQAEPRTAIGQPT